MDAIKQQVNDGVDGVRTAENQRNASLTTSPNVFIHTISEFNEPCLGSPAPSQCNPMDRFSYTVAHNVKPLPRHRRLRKLFAANLLPALIIVSGHNIMHSFPCC